MTEVRSVYLRDVAISRSGDKTNTVNIVVIPLQDDDWDLLRVGLTCDVVARTLKGRVKGAITRYELPGIRALNFVLEDALDGGVASSLRLDGHGKSYQSLILEAVFDVPEVSAAVGSADSR
jgi:hypothetical protein